MHEDAEVWLVLMNILRSIMFNHHFDTHLAPGRNSNNVPDIPTLCMFNDLMQFLIPVLDSCYPSAGLVKCLEPKRSVLRKNPAKVTGKPASFSFLQICSTT